MRTRASAAQKWLYRSSKYSSESVMWVLAHKQASVKFTVLGKCNGARNRSTVASSTAIARYEISMPIHEQLSASMRRE